MSGSGENNGSAPPVGAKSLENVVSVGKDGRVRYPESYAAYGKIYKHAPRSIRDWVRIGKEVGDLPPLYDAPGMVLWWKRNMKHEVPGAIIGAARSSAAAVEERLELEEFVDRPAEFATFDLSAVDSGNAEDGYNRTARLEAMAYQRLAEEMAKAEPDKGEVDYWTSAYKNQQLARRQWEKDINKIRKDRGELLDKASLVAELAALAGGIARNFERSLRAIIDELAPADMPPDARHDLAIRHRDRCFAELRENEFSAAMQGHD